jgi:hypothetical protein
VIGAEGHKVSIHTKLNDSFQEKESRNKPGPGSYDTTDKLDKFLRAQPSFGIGTSKRTESVPKERLVVPDATRYEPKDEFTKTKSAAFGFGTA